MASRADPVAGWPRMPARSLGSRACSFSTCSWLLDYAGPDGNSRLRSRQCGPSRYKHTVGARIAFFEAQFPARRCLCLPFTRHLAAPSARLEVKMVRYSFLVGLFHPRLHAGLSRPLRLLTRHPSGILRVDVLQFTAIPAGVFDRMFPGCATSCRLRMCCWPSGGLRVCCWRAVRQIPRVTEPRP